MVHICMRDYVLIYVNGQRHEVRGKLAFSSLSDFLRNDLALTGTKIVCAEGDCGSCSILLGKAGTHRIDYRTVCSCIQFVYQLDCSHIITVEGLQYDGHLNPVQEALVQFQGTQCGFCTPGFVVSLCAMFEDQKIASVDDVRANCVGNLCRCTGYESILRAGASIDGSHMRPLNALYPPEKMLAEFSRCAREDVQIAHGGKIFFKPAVISRACTFRNEHPDCTIISGGTDIGVLVNKRIREPKTILVTAGLRELETIEVSDGMIVAGARVSLMDLETLCSQHLPEFAKILYYFGSPPIRNAGTLGGNIANGSPIGDSMPALFVLNAEIELTGLNGARRVNINDFYTGYRKTVMRSDELITRIFIPLPRNDETLKLYKISRRKDLDISAFTAAFWMKRDDETITDIRIAYGGVAPTIVRMPKTEAFLRGKRLDTETAAEAGAIARTEVSPITDVRGSADYRLQLCENIILKLQAELNESAPVMY
jgi:xanthine dehydrogenase small subunit